MMVVTIGAALLGGGILLAIVVNILLKKQDSIELVQGKLENSDSAIVDAIPYLKVTNEWSK